MATPKHALVIGASGISGWAILNQLLTYPTPSTWSRITGTTNRPLSLSDAQIAPTDQVANGGRINLISGVDFTKPIDEVNKLLKAKIPNIETVTHVFFTAYIHNAESDYDAVVKTNVALVDTVVKSLEIVAPNMQFFVLQTGGKHYGLDFGPEAVPELLKSPYEESRPRVPPPIGDKIFYYGQIDVLRKASVGKQWTWCETRPDVITGFVPGGRGSMSQQDAARGLALYLALYRKVHGEGAECNFLGDEKSWSSSTTDSSQDAIARVSIFAALRPEECGGGEAFNTVDLPTTWESKWPILCAEYGLKGVGPGDQAMGMEELYGWVGKYKKETEDLVKENGLVGNPWEPFQWFFLWAITVVLNYDKEYDMRKIKTLGFKDQIKSIEG